MAKEAEKEAVKAAKEAEKEAVSFTVLDGNGKVYPRTFDDKEEAEKYAELLGGRLQR